MNSMRFIAAASALATGASAYAQDSELMRFDLSARHVDSGMHERAASETDLSTHPQSAFRTVVRSPGVNMMRVHFGAFDLGEHSELEITSIADGATQHFTHRMLTEWDGWSAIFNGDGVVIDLKLAPGERAWFQIDAVSTNDPHIHAEPIEGGVASLCGPDNRAASSDSRVGRLSSAMCGTGGNCGGCTAWLTSIGCAVAAGHCANASGGLIEFNVPTSLEDGSPQASQPEDQYPVGMTFYQFQDGGIGQDWAVMSVGPNANTGLRAHWVQGYFHLSPDMPANGAVLRVTGYGVDDSPAGSQPSVCCGEDSDGNCTHMGCNSSSLTQQTATGTKSAHSTTWLTYQVDTEPANSGSPILHENPGLAIGVHTNGGCQDNGQGANSGTRLSQSTMNSALNSFLGGAMFVDFVNVTATQNGTALNPRRTLFSAVDALTPGGTIVLAGGTYTAAAGNSGIITKACTINAVSGTVSIGN